MNVKDGTTPLCVAAENGHKQIVEILLEKGKPNVDLPDEVILLIVSFFFSFFFFLLSHFSILLNVKYGITPLYAAAFKGHEQIVQILLEKGNPNVDLPDEVILLIVSFFFLFLFFSLSHFSIFLNVKDGRTPLYAAAQFGHEQIVQLLLEKGKANVDLATKVLLLIVSFSFFSFSLSFFHFFLIKIGWTPLHRAVKKGFEEIIKILINHRANINIQTRVYFSIHFFSFSILVVLR